MKRSLFFHATGVDQVNSLKEHSHALLGQLNYWLACYSDREGNISKSEKVNELLNLVRANILSRDQLNDILQDQINLLMKDRMMLTESETIVLPGQILQNETRINWEALRKQYKIVLDRPVGFYRHYIYELLKQSIPGFSDPEMSFGDALSFNPRPEYPLEQIEYLDRVLVRKGLCRRLDLSQLQNKFCWVYFCALDIKTLPISISLHNSLRQHDINCLGDALSFSKEKLMTVRMFGMARLEELLRLLYAMGLSLDMQAADFRKLYGV
ncbi:MAG: DNA-directed RNA polymerase subunit alpha C-terminal domain-containing protein [Puia sp.]